MTTMLVETNLPGSVKYTKTNEMLEFCGWYTDHGASSVSVILGFMAVLRRLSA